MPLRSRLMQTVPAAAIGFLFLAAATVTFADSGVGVDTWRANKLDPTGGQATKALDPDGTSWLVAGQCHSPSGYLHSGDQKYALYDRYARWPTDGAAFDVDVNAERPSDGSYAEVRGSRISAEDQYYQAVYGQAGAYKIEA